jgi:Domain of unknown function (DUF4411)
VPTGGGNRIYVVDASRWISVEGHPAQNLMLYCLSKLIDGGGIISPPECWDEVQNVPWVHAWLKRYQRSFINRVATVEYYQMVGRVTRQFHVMAGARRKKERADQYVVGMAACLNVAGTSNVHVVVCEESHVKRPNRKIRTACTAFEVECIDLFSMLRKEFPDEPWPD